MAVLSIALLVLLLATSDTAGFTARHAHSQGNDALVILNTKDTSSYHEAIEAVEDSGGEVTQGFLPNAFVASFGGAAVPAPLTQSATIAVIATDAVNLAAIEPFGAQAVAAGRIWNHVYRGQLDPAPFPPPPLEENPPTLPPLQFQEGSAAGGSNPSAPGVGETAEFMAGRSLVELVFVESSNTPGNCPPTYPQTENWDETRKQEVRDQVAAGLKFWTDRLNRPSPISFNEEERTLPTSCEPISRPPEDLKLWIPDLLTAMGCLGATPDNFNTIEAQCLHQRRTELQFDWAYFIFVVDSFNAPNGWAFAHANLHVVMTYDDNLGNWSISGMHLLAAHETGHVFGAWDEYSGHCDTTSPWGYLQVPNTSCNDGGDTSDVSIMAELVDGTDVSISARGAIGWRNPTVENGKTMVDVVRTQTIDFTAFLPDPSPANQPVYTAIANNVPYPPGPGRSPVSISRVKDVEWRMDGGVFASAIPTDGAFGGASERFRFYPSSPLPNGNHTFEVHAINQFGFGALLPYTDTLNVAFDGIVDTDGDRCPDYRELGPYETQGGFRDYLNPWDYFNPTHDGSNGVPEVLMGVQQYFHDDSDLTPGLPPYAPGYNVDTDRTALGPNLWNLGPPNGTQTVPDILAVLKQYFHDCS